MRKKCVLLLIVPLVLAGLLSCGLEELFYIAPVFEDSISIEMTNTATIRLPDSGGEGYNYFSNFIIFYRIYISDNNPDTVDMKSSEARRAINLTLDSDWNTFYPYTDITNTSVNTSNMDTLFFNRGYYMLTLESEDRFFINKVLDATSLGKTLIIHFSQVNGEKPVMNFGSLDDETNNTLYRANTINDVPFAPEPNRYFFNTIELCDSEKAVSTINADVNVTANSSTPQAGERHAYVSMYIAAMGREKLTRFYSTPAFIGIFKLPRAN